MSKYTILDSSKNLHQVIQLMSFFTIHHTHVKNEDFFLSHFKSVYLALRQVYQYFAATYFCQSSTLCFIFVLFVNCGPLSRCASVVPVFCFTCVMTFLRCMCLSLFKALIYFNFFSTDTLFTKLIAILGVVSVAFCCSVTLILLVWNLLLLNTFLC